jgi:hypothetical protein
MQRIMLILPICVALLGLGGFLLVSGQSTTAETDLFNRPGSIEQPTSPAGRRLLVLAPLRDDFGYHQADAGTGPRSFCLIRLSFFRET